MSAAREMSLSCVGLFAFIEKHKLALLNLKCCPTRPDEATITEVQKDFATLSLTYTTISETHTNTSYRLMMRQQSLQDAMKDIKSFNPSNNIHHFISNLNQAYMIMPELTNHPDMEKEFMKITKQLLNWVIFQQDIFDFKQLKLYLIATHSNQMSNFQHLSQASDLQQ